MQAVLDYFIQVLERSNARVRRLTPPVQESQPLDLGLRQDILGLAEPGGEINSLLADCGEDTVFLFTDGYQCSYMLMRLPQGEYLLSGPTLFERMTPERYDHIAGQMQIPDARHSAMLEYYASIECSLAPHTVSVMVSCLAEKLYGAGRCRVVFPSEEDLIWQHQGAFPPEEDPLLTRKQAADRYLLEAELMEAIRQGNSIHAITYTNALLERAMQQHAAPPLREVKNELLGMNMFLRLAAQSAQIPANLVDTVYLSLMRTCEELGSIHKVNIFTHRMVQDYCRLVRRHAQRDHSATICKTLDLIDMDLTADLSLRSLARQVNVNASYLSAQFRKEVGQSLTDYVNGKRVELACYLLRTTNLQIKWIVERIGVSDVYYFSRLFKKHMGVSPLKYREKYRGIGGEP